MRPIRSRLAPHSLGATALALALAVCGGAAAEVRLAAEVRNGAGEAVADAVVALYGEGAAVADPPRAAVMDPKDKQSVPHVLPIQVGADVSFPNSDQIRHHVYSFSEAKRFEPRLYSGEPAAPVRFDRLGTVVLGCNIHDHMLGYVRVPATPHFARTDADGRAELSGVDEDDGLSELERRFRRHRR